MWLCEANQVVNALIIVELAKTPIDSAFMRVTCARECRRKQVWLSDAQGTNAMAKRATAPKNRTARPVSSTDPGYCFLRATPGTNSAAPLNAGSQTSHRIADSIESRGPRTAGNTNIEPMSSAGTSDATKSPEGNHVSAWTSFAMSLLSVAERQRYPPLRS